jgi:hypothetical protein
VTTKTAGIEVPLWGTPGETLTQHTGKRGGGKRYYTHPDSPGHKLWSSTTVLAGTMPKPALMYWSAKVTREAFQAELAGRIGKTLTSEQMDAAVERAKQAPRQTSDAALNLGLAAHKAIEQLTSGVEMDIPDEIRPAIDSWQAWRKAAGIDIIAQEVAVCDRVAGYAGTVDAIARSVCPVHNKTKYVVIDYKTSKAIYEEYHYQVASYAVAAERHLRQATPIPCCQPLVKGVVVRLGKETAEFEVAEVDIDNAYRVFIAANALFQTLQ